MQVWVQLPSRVPGLNILLGPFYCMYFVYILYSKDFDRYYVGQCENLDARLKRHNNKAVSSTKAYSPWQMIYTETFSTRALAYQRESEIKKKKSRKYIEFLIRGNKPNVFET